MLNDLSTRVLGKELVGSYGEPLPYTGERVGLQYLHHQAGKPMIDLSELEEADLDLEDEVNAILEDIDELDGVEVEEFPDLPLLPALVNPLSAPSPTRKSDKRAKPARVRRARARRIVSSTESDSEGEMITPRKRRVVDKSPKVELNSADTNPPVDLSAGPSVSSSSTIISAQPVIPNLTEVSTPSITELRSIICTEPPNLTKETILSSTAGSRLSAETSGLRASSEVSNHEQFIYTV